MKKQFFYAALAAAAVLTACNKTPEPAPASEGNKVTIRAVLPQTKVAASAAETGLSWSWEAGDKLTIIGSTTEVFDIKSGFTAREAEFDGTAVSSGPYTILYPGTLTSMTDAEGYDWTKQKQVGNDSPAHLQYLAALEGVDQYEEFSFDAEWAAAHGGTLKQSGVVKFVLTLPEAITGVKKVEAVIPAASVSVGLELEDVTLAEGNVLTAYAGFPWIDLEVPVALETTVMVTTDTDVVWNKTITLPAGASIQSGKVNNVVLNVNGWECTGRYAGGTGVEGDPWLIDNAQRLFYMKEDLEASDEGATTYFALVADIDMSGNEQLAGINAATPYKIIHLDGRNHKISNLKITNTSGYNGGLFGILYGTLKNLTIANAEVTSSSKSTGIIACWAGANDETTWAKLENVKVQGGSITQNNTTQVGGIAGKARNVTFTNCSVQGVTITTTTCAASGSSDNGYGGIAGWAHTCTFKGCSFDGTLNGARLTGGIAGYAAAAVNFEDCQTAGTIKVSKLNNRNGEVGGGIVGWWGGSYVRGCSSTANVTTENNVSGGIVGQVGVNGGVIEKCTYSTGTIQSGGNNAGGIVAYCERTATVQKCFFNGTVQSGASNAGGIVAVTNNSYASTVTNCYSSGYVKIPKGQCAGGIVGELGTKSVVTNCYSTSEMDGQRCMGGIVGRANSGGWTANAASGNTISGCIAWNPHIICTDRRDANSAGGSGTIVGFTSVKNILTGGYRKADIVFVPSDSDYDGSGVDQPDCDGTNWTMGVTPGTGKTYQCPYHGTAAAASATVSSVAQSLGWDASVWDFSGSLPTLK